MNRRSLLGALLALPLLPLLRRAGPAAAIAHDAPSYGKPIPVVYGETRVGRNIVWSSDFEVEGLTMPPELAKRYSSIIIRPDGRIEAYPL